MALGTRTPTASQFVHADINQDGRINIADVLLLQKRLLEAWLGNGSPTRVAAAADTPPAPGALAAAWLDWFIPMARALPNNAGKVYYVHNDPLGTPQALTDESGTVVWKADYDPFGKATVNEDPDGDGNRVTLNVRFPGQYYDQETGLHYNYFRYYDPATGRYLASDPIGLRGSLNTYAYVDANPINAIDPSGLVKLYGSWCGPDWTGGFRRSYDELDAAQRRAALPPIDGLDQCCQTHDVTYASCRENFPCDPDKRSQCFQEADRLLSSCASGAGGGQSPMILLFGNPQDRIQEFMDSSSPGPGPNSEDCGCKE